MFIAVIGADVSSASRVPEFVGLLLCVAIAIGVVLLRGPGWLLKGETRWKTLAAKFPAGSANAIGVSYQKQSAFFGAGNGKGVHGRFAVELAREGFLITPNFASRLPVLIPWTAIGQVNVAKLLGTYDVILVTVDYEPGLKFVAPTAALAAIREYVPTAQLQDVPSLVALINKAAL